MAGAPAAAPGQDLAQRARDVRALAGVQAIDDMAWDAVIALLPGTTYHAYLAVEIDLAGGIPAGMTRPSWAAPSRINQARCGLGAAATSCRLYGTVDPVASERSIAARGGYIGPALTATMAAIVGLY